MVVVLMFENVSCREKIRTKIITYYILLLMRYMFSSFYIYSNSCIIGMSIFSVGKIHNVILALFNSLFNILLSLQRAKL